MKSMKQSEILRKFNGGVVGTAYSASTGRWNVTLCGGCRAPGRKCVDACPGQKRCYSVFIRPDEEYGCDTPAKVGRIAAQAVAEAFERIADEEESDG